MTGRAMKGKWHRRIPGIGELVHRHTVNRHCDLFAEIEVGFALSQAGGVVAPSKACHNLLEKGRCMRIADY